MQQTAVSVSVCSQTIHAWKPRRLSLPSVWYWQIILGLTLSFLPSRLSLSQCFLCLESVGQLAAIFLPLHHLFVARDVSGVQQLVDGGVLCKEDKWRKVSWISPKTLYKIYSFVDLSMHQVQNTAWGLITPAVLEWDFSYYLVLHILQIPICSVLQYSFLNII